MRFWTERKAKMFLLSLMLPLFYPPMRKTLFHLHVFQGEGMAGGREEGSDNTKGGESNF